MAIESVAIEITTNYKQVEKQLDILDSHLAALRKAKTEISIDTTDVERAIKALEELQTTLRGIDKQEVSLNISDDSAITALDSLDVVSKSLNDIDSNTASVNVDDTSVISTYEAIDALEKQIEAVSRQQIEVQADKKSIDDLSDAIEATQKGLQELDRRHTSINISHNLHEIGDSLDGIGRKLTSLVNPLSGSLGDIVGLVSVVNVLDSAFETLSRNMDTAIYRFDTLNQYPKVMKALGHSTDDADSSINKLADGIDGLPTKLQDIVSVNQQLVSITGDLDKGTDLTIGLNNALLASGANTIDTTRAIRQFSKQLGQGEVNLVSWRTLIDTMPASLTKLANSLGYTGNNAMYDLYDAIDDGSISIDTLIDKIIELGTGT